MEQLLGSPERGIDVEFARDAIGSLQPRERRTVPRADLDLPAIDRLDLALWVIDGVRIDVLADVAHQLQARNSSVKRRGGSGDVSGDRRDACRDLDRPAKAAECQDQELKIRTPAHDEALIFWLIGREPPTLKRDHM
ncbi:MAG: hypothetical protein ABSH51_28770 [Solirubrobacteraceae bacterium]